MQSWKALLLNVAGAVAVCGAGEWSVRVLPEPAATSHAPLRLGLQAGFLDGRFHSLRAERFCGSDWSAEEDVTLRIAAAADQVDRPICVVQGAGGRRGGVVRLTRPLRRGVRHTLRLKGRRISGSGSVWVTFTSVSDESEDSVTKRITLKNGIWCERELHVVPQRETVYQCRLAFKPDSVVELGSLSLTADDAEGGWDHESLEALRTMRPGVIGWPAAKDLGMYHWCDGVGPLAVRHPAVPSAVPDEGHSFGTAEFVVFCRLTGAQPMLRITVFDPRLADERMTDLAAGIQMATEWVAYCNATNDHPLALLRRRHGHAEPFRVTRWELTACGGAVPAVSIAAAYEAAMRSEDSAIHVVTGGEASLPPLHDRYVTAVLQRLEEASAEERTYYAEWYGALSLAYAAIDTATQARGGLLCTPLQPEQVLCRAPRARNMLTDAGALLAIINRYPAERPLVVEGAPEAASGGPRVQATWSDEASGLVVFIYNSSPLPHTVRIDLTPMGRRFMLCVSDQMAADLTARRDASVLPVNRIQKVGAAISQTVVCEAAPCSFTRLLVRE